MPFASRPKTLAILLALIGALTSGPAAATSYTARFETKDALALTVYEGERAVASLICKEPDSRNGLLTLFVFPLGAPVGVEVASSQQIPLTMELRIDSAIFGSQTFKAAKVQAEIDRKSRVVRVAGDLSSQETEVFASLLTAETMAIALNGRAISVAMSFGAEGMDVVVNGCGKIRDAVEKADNVEPQDVTTDRGSSSQAAAPYTARFAAAETAASLGVYDGDRVVAAITCQEPDNAEGPMTVAVFLPDPKVGGVSPGNPFIVNGRKVPALIEVTMANKFGGGTFRPRRVDLEVTPSGALRLVGDLSDQEGVLSGMSFAETIEIAGDGRVMKVDIGPGRIADVLARCGAIINAAAKAGKLGPPKLADQSLWDTKDGWRKP